MRPDPPVVLLAVAGALQELLPHVPDAYGQQTLGIAASLVGMLAQEWDRAPARLWEENEAVRQLLARGAELPGLAPSLRARLREGGQARVNPGARLSELQAENDRLRALLIELHAAVEELDGEEARALDEEIWAELVASTRRRHVESGL